MQDFTIASDIDWLGDIDKQMYLKYKLSAEEIEFIEKNIRAMTWKILVGVIIFAQIQRD